MNTGGRAPLVVQVHLDAQLGMAPLPGGPQLHVVDGLQVDLAGGTRGGSLPLVNPHQAVGCQDRQAVLPGQIEPSCGGVRR